MIKMTINASRRLRASAALLLALGTSFAAPAARAALDEADSYIELPGAGADARSTVSEVMARIESGSTPASSQRELQRDYGRDYTRGYIRPITLAQLEDQLRRPEVQASIGKGTIAVLYPNVEAQFRPAFTSIIQGIEERTKLRVRSYPVDPKVDVAELNATLKHNGTKVVIALGRQGLNATAGLDREITVLVGGVLLLSDAENVAGISLTPDPALLFARLHALLPVL
jgi:putative ABC transport system substrate-binding protein